MLGIAERTKKGELHRFLRNNADFTCTLRLKVALSLTPLVVFAGLRVSLHAVVQFHQDRFQTGVHPLDQLMVHHQRPQQNAQR